MVGGASPLSDGIQAATDYGYYDYDYNYNGSLVILGEDEPQQFGRTFSSVLYTLIFILSLVGNSFLLWALLVREDLRKTTTLFLLQLAVSDLLVTLTLPFWAVYHLHHWVFSTPGCHLLVFLFFLGFYGYMAFLAAVTVDRYLAVVHAVLMRRLQSRLCVALFSASLWLVCVAASVPEAGCRSARRAQAVRLIFCMVLGIFACWAPYNVVLILGALQLLGCPGLTGPEAKESLAYAYYVCHALAYCHCFLNPALHVFGSERFRSYLSVGLLFLLPLAVVVYCYARHRTVTVVLCIVAAFFVCWGPYNVLLVLEAMYGTGGTDCDSRVRMDLALACTRVLAYCHCCFNPTSPTGSGPTSPKCSSAVARGNLELPMRGRGWGRGRGLAPSITVLTASGRRG
ncbi:chemokine XC receptor 1-like [Anguilla rostrata]|uniref:chemokine XC receptor 1-like n=1 Tax=Anguilla rostrata TaxID=7938 RepID=UPI0030D1A03D